MELANADTSDSDTDDPSLTVTLWLNDKKESRFGSVLCCLFLFPWHYRSRHSYKWRTVNFKFNLLVGQSAGSPFPGTVSVTLCPSKSTTLCCVQYYLKIGNYRIGTDADIKINVHWLNQWMADQTASTLYKINSFFFLFSPRYKLQTKNE